LVEKKVGKSCAMGGGDVNFWKCRDFVELSLMPLVVLFLQREWHLELKEDGAKGKLKREIMEPSRAEN